MVLVEVGDRGGGIVGRSVTRNDPGEARKGQDPRALSVIPENLGFSLKAVGSR